MTPRGPASGNGGLSLLELLLAVVILGLAAAGMGKVMVGAAQSGRMAGAIGYRTAVLNTEVARVLAAPYDALADGTTIATVTTPPFPYRLTSVVLTSGTTKTVTITVTPLGERVIPAVVRSVQRSIATVSPFGAP